MGVVKINSVILISLYMKTCSIALKYWFFQIQAHFPLEPAKGTRSVRTIKANPGPDPEGGDEGNPPPPPPPPSHPCPASHESLGEAGTLLQGSNLAACKIAITRFTYRSRMQGDFSVINFDTAVYYQHCWLSYYTAMQIQPGKSPKCEEHCLPK